MMKLNNSDARKLGKRVEELEAREVVLRDQEFIGRTEVQQAFDGMAQVLQQALNDQGMKLQQMVQTGQRENAQAARVAEARAQAMAMAPSQPPVNPLAVQEMRSELDHLKREMGVN